VCLLLCRAWQSPTPGTSLTERLQPKSTCGGGFELLFFHLTTNAWFPRLSALSYRTHLLFVVPHRGYWTFWQYNDNGQIPGISGNVDVDYFAGTEANLRNLCF
jgi:hypothetical protein